VLQHHVYLKDDILKQTHSTVTFAVSGLKADELKKYLLAGEKICEFEYNERERIHSFRIVSDFFMINPFTDRGTMKTQHEVGQEIKPEEVRYIILGEENPESKFRKLKALLPNVHWIHVEDGSLLWRDSNCNIDIIRRHIDETKCRNYDIKNVMEQSDRTMLLVAEPGMGKSTFLSDLEHEIKERNPAVWVLRINLIEHTKLLDDMELEGECIDKCKKFLWSAAHTTGQDALGLAEYIFTRALRKTGKMVILFDGFDEISPHYTKKVNMLIRAIREKTPSQILVSSRFSQRPNLEDVLIKLAFTLQPFKRENQISFNFFFQKLFKDVPEGFT
jgi:hypothetical protein